MSNVGSGHTYVGNGETTEWEDILVKKGIWEEREEVDRTPDYIADRIDKKDDEGEQADCTGDLNDAGTDELDDELDDLLDDSIFMEKFRAQRLSQMQQTAAANKFGDVRPIEKSEWVREVTEGSKGQWVVAFLYQPGMVECALMEQTLTILAAKHKYCKFVKMRSTSCMENWPDKRLPTLFMYHDEELQQNMFTLAEVGGLTMSVDDLEWHLAELKVLKTELTAKPIMKKAESPTRRDFVNRVSMATGRTEDDRAAAAEDED
jgi:hypothetical protein